MNETYLNDLISDEAKDFLKEPICDEISSIFGEEIKYNFRLDSQFSLKKEFSQLLIKDSTNLIEYEKRMKEVLLYIDYTFENGTLEPAYVFSSHEDWNQGFIAITSKGIEDTLKEL